MGQVIRRLNFEIDASRIPPLLKGLNCWVTWRAGESKPSGKFDKVPIDAVTGRSVSANQAANWLTFDAALTAYQQGRCSGIGVALSGSPVTEICGIPYYLIAIDLDNYGQQIKEANELRKSLGGIYGEISPSLKGVRMFALSRESIKGGNAGEGRELYGSGRFVTVTGLGGKGELKEATNLLLGLQQKWFPTQASKSKATSTLTAHLATRPETAQNIANVQAQLACMSADCSYEQWRNIVWAVLSSGWKCAEDVSRGWSQTATSRYTVDGFDAVVNSFDPAGGITLGTLDHHAREAGWKPSTQPPASTPFQSEITSPQAHSRLLTRDDLFALPSMVWRIRDVLPAYGLAAIYGASGSGKSFLAIDMAFAIASGHSTWFGSKVKSAPVVYVALEGQAGISGRLTALEIDRQQSASNALRFRLDKFTLLDPADSQALATDILEAVGEGAVVFIDTLNQSAPSADENSSKDMGQIIANAKDLAALVKGVVVLVHHTGKNAGLGMRGHSSLFAAMDAAIEVERNASGRAWRLAKSKEGETGDSRAFELVPQIVGRDEDGYPVTSCALRHLPYVVSSRALRPVSGKHRREAIDVLRKMLQMRVGGVPIKEAIDAVASILDCPSDRRTARATEAINGLTESGHLQASDGLIFIPRTGESPRTRSPIGGIGETVMGIEPNRHRSGFSANPQPVPRQRETSPAMGCWE